MKRRLQRVASALMVFALLLSLAPVAPAIAGPSVDVNRATEEELVELPGIGPAKAKAIVEYRSAHPFETVEELMNVRGIGENTFESLKDKVHVGSAAADSAKR